MNDLNAPRRLLSARGLDLDEPLRITTQVQTWKTQANTRVRFVEAHGLPMVDLLLRFRAGSVQDGPQSGLAALTLYNLDKGSAGLSADEHALRLERLGAVVDKRVRLDYAQLSLRSLSSPGLLAPAVALFRDLAAHPDFPAPALETVKSLLLANHASLRTHAQSRVSSEIYRHLFTGHPYGIPEGSSAEGVAAIGTDDLRTFHRKAFSANNLEMVMVGDLSRAQAEAIAEQISQALPQGWAATELPAPPPAQPARIHIEQNGASSTLAMAVPLPIPVNAPEYLGLVLANEVLGYGPESRLMQMLRQRHGLTYDVTSHLVPLQTGGLLLIQWETASAHVDASLALVRQTLETLCHEGPSLAELRFARQQISGQWVRSVAQNQRLASMLVEQAQLGLADDYLNTYLSRLSAIDTRQVRELTQSNLDLTRQVVASVGPAVAQMPLPSTDQ
ncbi:M16 family metallopeptidase [Pseudomonas sp. CCOS 191]|uniref:M16 family metallopeptidase n=1 Tax=Pseudomonas sp. CCOS 191 TaxID=1649877 RepID=UPI0018E67164|nr:pitrilysin family protein [Pseudomonas sp. CCOS 191]MBI6953277.1 insulinase family protein [Pseudomonas sp. CCOS 191]